MVHPWPGGFTRELWGKLARAGHPDSYITLSPGEQLALEFGIPEAAPGTKRVFLFWAKGYYESLEALEKTTSGPAGKGLSFVFEPPYPNPFNPSTAFRFSLPSREHVTLVVYNVLGQVVYRVVDQEYDAGDHVVHWEGHRQNGQAVASGIYFARFTAGPHTATRKMMVVK